MSHHSPMDLRKRTLILIASLVFTLNTVQLNYVQAKSRSNHHDINSRDLSNSYHESNSSQNEVDLREVIARPNYKTDGNNDTRLSTLSTTSIAAVLSQEDSGKPSFCITTPQNMSFCTSKLAWAPTTAMPNLLGHRSEDELNAFLSLYPLQDLTNVKCKASHHFKLMLCSVLTPVCLDASLIPCRHLCIAAKSSCESAFKRQGLEWPKFLDCRRFPRKNQNDNCIERQPALISTNLQMTTCIHDRHELNSTKPSVKRKQKEKKNRSKPAVPGKTKSTTDTTTTSTTAATPFLAKSDPSSENLATKEDYLSSYPTTPGDNFDSSTLSSLDNRSSLLTNETIRTITTTTTTTTTTTATPLSSTVSKDLATTSQSAATIANTINLQEMKSQSNNESTMNLDVPIPEESSNTFRQDYSSMPSNVTNDLTQLICSTSPDWLIKTKLSDGQLVNAVQRRNLKVRSYLQIFGSLANKDGAISSTTQPQDSRKSVRTNLHLELSNTTVFIYPLAANLYIQPISEASKSNQDSTQFKSTIRYYLIAGTGANDTVKSTNVFILWPSGKVSMSPDSQGSINVIKTYREFKHKGLRVCSHQGRKQLGRPPQQMTNLTEFEGYNTQGTSINNQQNQQSSNRYRRNKKKRVQTTVSE